MVATAKKVASAVKQPCFDAFSFRQRGKSGPELVMFRAAVGEILKFAAVDELTPTSRGPARAEGGPRTSDREILESG